MAIEAMFDQHHLPEDPFAFITGGTVDDCVHFVLTTHCKTQVFY